MTPDLEGGLGWFSTLLTFISKRDLVGKQAWEIHLPSGALGSRSWMLVILALAVAFSGCGIARELQTACLLTLHTKAV